MKIIAIRLTGKKDNLLELSSFIKGQDVVMRYPEKVLLLKTLEGVMKVRIGDHVVKGATGGYFACKPGKQPNAG
ncbi:MAG TPA: hypothetical protein ENI07_14300 [Desulfobacterales bacterium]|nr:hypothetical protein [Desulfobacterales bacterium]